MKRSSLLHTAAALTSLTFALAPAGAATGLTTRDRVSTAGIGPVRIGMTPEEAARAVGVPFDRDESGETACYFVTPRGGPEGIAFMVSEGRIARVDVDEPGFTTVSGARVGSTEAEIKRMYPGRIEVSNHEYVDGHYLTYVPKDPKDRNFRVVFETDGTRVTSFRAGKLPEVGYVEGCS